MNNLYIVLYISFFILGCSEEKTSTGVPYFSVPEFISQQTKELLASKTSLKRKVIFNQNPEEMVVRNPDWEKELKPFFECDLNLPAWKNGFETDTTDAGGTRIIHYTAREKRIAIRELELRLSGDSVSSLSIVYLKSNPWYSLGRTLTYEPGKGYSIIIEQDTPIQTPETIRVEGRFQ